MELLPLTLPTSPDGLRYRVLHPPTLNLPKCSTTKINSWPLTTRNPPVLYFRTSQLVSLSWHCPRHSLWWVHPTARPSRGSLPNVAEIQRVPGGSKENLSARRICPSCGFKVTNIFQWIAFTGRNRLFLGTPLIMDTPKSVWSRNGARNVMKVHPKTSPQTMLHRHAAQFL